MAASTTNRDEAMNDGPAFERVETFIACVETKRQRAQRVRMVAAAVGILAAGVAILTSVGVVPPDAGKLTVSAGAIVAGFFAGDR